MNIRLGPKASDIFVVIYLVSTLILRFMIESELKGRYLISILMGAFALLFLWALSKTKIINPTWFGLLGARNKTEK